jgi:hypothetical protein
MCRFAQADEDLQTWNDIDELFGKRGLQSFVYEVAIQELQKRAARSVCTHIVCTLRQCLTSVNMCMCAREPLFLEKSGACGVCYLLREVLIVMGKTGAWRRRHVHALLSIMPLLSLKLVRRCFEATIFKTCVSEPCS